MNLNKPESKMIVRNTVCLAVDTLERVIYDLNRVKEYCTETEEDHINCMVNKIVDAIDMAGHKWHVC